jgi:DNA-binding beta-propeller fold protein YncE
MLPAIRLVATGLCILLSASAAGAERLVLVAGGAMDQEGLPATQAKLRGPFGIDFNRSGEMFLVELAGGRVLTVDTAGRLTRLAGTGEKGDQGDGGPALQAVFNGMHSLVVAPDGALLLADTWNNRVRRLDPPTGRLSAFAGTGEKGFAGDGGPALQARFGGIYCIALDPPGKRLYLADLDNRRIRRIDLASGIVSTVAGNGEKGVPQDGAMAAQAPLVDPRAVAVDRQGNVYVLERSGHALRVVDAAGKIRTVVGTGKKGSQGDGGPALQAELNGPKHLCIDLEDNVIIADAENHLIRRYLPKEGKIVRVAGTGKRGTAGIGGSPLEAELNQPHGVCVNAAGTLYIVDSSNNRVLGIEK